jgi:NADH-quinone oxidoreductase subunit M
MHALPWTIHLSLIGAVLAAAWPRGQASGPRWVALLTSCATFALGLQLFFTADPARDGWVELVRVPWIPALGIEFHLAADGISAALVLLTGLASLAGVLFSWNVSHRPGAFFGLYLLLIAGVFGVFLSADAFLLFLFYELAIVPKYFLIAIWGSTRREYGAMKLALYSFAGSAMVLAGLVAVAALSGVHGFDLQALAANPLPRDLQLIMFPLVFLGFGVLAGLWPFHTWAPTGHVAAPTAASMLLAGVIMKLGAYGCLRVAMPLFPAALAPWQVPLAVLAVAGIVHGALAAWTQRDFKFVIGYSSVSHMGFVMLGLATLNIAGLSGAVVQMVSHGIIAGLLFAVVGRMVYDRTHERDLPALATMNLGQSMPFAASVFLLAGLASMGLPGFSGFVAELAVLQGAWAAFPALVVPAAAGVFFASAYILRALRLGFFADPESVPSVPSVPSPAYPPPTTPEIAGALILLAATLAIGLAPGWLLAWIEAGLATPLMRGIFLTP